MRVADVAVVGGGPSGSVLSFMLARAGLDVVLVDRARFPRMKPCGGGLDGIFWSYLPAELRGAVEGVVERSAETMWFVWERAVDDVLYAEIPHPAAMTRRTRLDDVLVKGAASAGVHVIEGVHVSKIGREDGWWVLPEAGVRCRILVGADGAHSTVARQTGLRQKTLLYVASEWDIAPSRRWLPDPVILIHASHKPLGYYWIFQKADHWNVGVGVPRKYARRVHDMTRAYSEAWGVDGEPRRVAHHIPFARKGHEVVRDDLVVLVGDAAGVVDPATGGGIGWGVRYAAWVRGHIVRAARAMRVGDAEGARAEIRKCAEEHRRVLMEARAGEALRNCLVLACMARRRSLAERHLRDILAVVSARDTYLAWARRNPWMYRLGRAVQMVVERSVR